MGQLRRTYLTGDKIWACKKCKTHLTTQEMFLSDKFRSRHGPAILFEAVVNVDQGPIHDKHMNTGEHKIRNISCTHCHVVLGWRYEHATESTQKYKEGRYILEKALLVDRTPGAALSPEEVATKPAAKIEWWEYKKDKEKELGWDEGEEEDEDDDEGSEEEEEGSEEEGSEEEGSEEGEGDGRVAEYEGNGRTTTAPWIP